MAKKNEALMNLLKKVDNQYASIAGEGMLSDIMDYIDTGSYALNALISGSIYKGIATNKAMGLAGMSTTGKTYIALSIVENFLEQNEDNIVVYADSESAVDKEILVARGIDVNRVLYLPVATVEETTTQLNSIINTHLETYPVLKTRPKVLIVLDSLGQLSTNFEMKEADSGDSKSDAGRRAKLIKGLFRVLTMKLAKSHIPMLITNHIYNSMDKYTANPMSGGSGLQYAAHFIVGMTKTKDRNEEKELVGNFINFTLMKGRKSVEGKTVTVNLNFKSGLDRYSGLFDIAVNGDVFKKQGKYVVLPNGDKLFRSEIEENPEAYYTEEVLDLIDKAANNLFTFGKEDGAEDSEEAISEV